MTIKDSNTVAAVLRNSGKLEDMEFPYVFSYTSSMNQEDPHFALFQTVEQIDVFGNPFVIDPICLLDDGLMTDDGEEFLLD